MLRSYMYSINNGAKGISKCRTMQAKKFGGNVSFYEVISILSFECALNKNKFNPSGTCQWHRGSQESIICS